MSGLEHYYNAKSLCSVALTFDADWAPEFVLAGVLDTLRRHGHKATFFATNPSPALSAAAAERRIEVGWHPNFLPGSSHGATFDAVMQCLRAWYPGAVGVRTHSLHQNNFMLRSFPSWGLRYDSSLQLFDHPFLQVFSVCHGIARVPYCWSDAAHVLSQRAFHPEALPLATPGLKVLAFHPVLVALNLARHSAYDELKASCPNLLALQAGQMEPFAQGGAGVGTLFNDLCAWLARERVQTYLLGELVEAFHRQSGTDRPGVYRPYLFGARVPETRPHG
jgi:hypothetical protein